MTTIKTKIIAPESEKSLVIPMTIFDTGFDNSLISNNIVKHLKLTVDKYNAPDLSEVAIKSDTIGIVYGFGILVYNGENSKKIEDNFIVIKSDKDFLLLDVFWIDRANAILDFQNWQLTILLSAHKKITITISLHKRKGNVISLNIDFQDFIHSHNLKKIVSRHMCDRYEKEFPIFSKLRIHLDQKKLYFLVTATEISHDNQNS